PAVLEVVGDLVAGLLEAGHVVLGDALGIRRVLWCAAGIVGPGSPAGIEGRARSRRGVAGGRGRRRVLAGLARLAGSRRIICERGRGAPKNDRARQCGGENELPYHYRSSLVPLGVWKLIRWRVTRPKFSHPMGDGRVGVVHCRLACVERSPCSRSWCWRAAGRAPQRR